MIFTPNCGRGRQNCLMKAPPVWWRRWGRRPWRRWIRGCLAPSSAPGAGKAPALRRPGARTWLASTRPAPLFSPQITRSNSMALPTGGQRAEMPAFSDRAFDDWFLAQGKTYGLGLYGEKRSIYATSQFADAASPERRTKHLGVDVFAAKGTPVQAPLAGRVAHLTYNADPLDYGHTLILAHDAGVFTLYGHLGASLPKLLQPGQSVAAGQVIGHLGDWHENGGWAAHLHFQIITDMLDQSGGNFFGVGHESLWDVWTSISPDPNLILRLRPELFELA